MRNLNSIAALVLSLIFSASVNSDFDEGLVAFEQGNYAKALAEWEPLAEQGDANAQYRLGYLFSVGHGVKQDDINAFSWFLKAAKQGHIQAQFVISFMYAMGTGVSKDYSEAEKWWREAIEQELAIAHPGSDIDFVSEAQVAIGDAKKTFSSINVRLPRNIDNGRVVPVEILSSLDLLFLQLRTNRHDFPIATFLFEPDTFPYVSTRFRIGAPGTFYVLGKTHDRRVYSTTEISTSSKFVHGETNLRKCRASEVKLNAKQEKNLVNLRMLFEHCMNLDRYINELSVYKDGKMIVRALLSPGMSRNPFFGFKFEGSANGKYKLEWSDTSGKSYSKSFRQR